MFQFQSGAVKSGRHIHGNGRNHPRFNSKVVRLKVLRLNRIDVIHRMFQFQSGAVKRKQPISGNPALRQVSIPKWCG